MLVNRESSEFLLEPQFINGAIDFTLDRNPDLINIERDELFRFATTAANLMARFERLAQTDPLRVPKTSDDAKRIVAIWDLSHVGTYLKPYQEDRWKNVTWAGGTDRKRLNYSGTLIRRITEKVTGRSYRAASGEALTSEQVAQLKSDIASSGPYLIYGSTDEQNQDLETVLNDEGVIIPRSRAHIIYFLGKPVGVNTIDQVKNFRLPESVKIHEGDILGIVAHAPHLVRLLHILGRYKEVIPEGLIVQPFPIQSLPLGFGYSKLELSGLLAYTFLTGDSAEMPYPYKI